mgnify:CR=1 FL=1
MCYLCFCGFLYCVVQYLLTLIEQLFNTLPVEFLGYDGTVPAGQNYYIPCYDSIENRVEVDDAQGNQTHTEYRITQEASTAALISPFTALVFTSNALPIVSPLGNISV